MSARQQAALLLKDVHGFSTAELAATLEVTPGSAEVLLARARNSFRARFADIAGIEARALPAWIGASLVLPIVALPSGLLSPPAAPLHPLPGLSHAALGGGYAAPIGVAGGGLGSAIANSAALKFAAVLAAAATMTAGVSDVHHVAQRPAAPTARRSAAVRAARPSATRSGAAVALTHVLKHAARPSSGPVFAVAGSASPSPSSGTGGSAVSSPSPSPSDTRLGDGGPTPPATSPSPSPSVSPTPTPTPSATASDSPSPSPTPSAAPTGGDAPGPTVSPSP